MAATAEPLIIYDSREHAWWATSKPYRDVFMVWMHDHGLNAGDTFRIEVDLPYATVIEIVRDEDGRIVTDAGEPVTTSRTVTLSSLPPKGD